MKYSGMKYDFLLDCIINFIPMPWSSNYLVAEGLAINMFSILLPWVIPRRITTLELGFCQTPILGQELGIDFTFANNNNDNNE